MACHSIFLLACNDSAVMGPHEVFATAPQEPGIMV